MTQSILIPLLAVAMLCILPATAGAQAWTIDARSVGLGGIGGDDNIAAQALAEDRGDRSIVLPLGLFQVWQDRDVFKPNSAQLERLQFRGAASRVHDEWLPSGGLSLGITRRFWLDLATFMTTANIERERRFAVATSVRWQRGV